jgi:hypothetical protein
MSQPLPSTSEFNIHNYPVTWPMQWVKNTWLAVKTFPEWWALHCKGRTYGKAYLNDLECRTFMHTNTCSIDSATVGSTDIRFLLESSRVRPTHLISCPPWLRNMSPWGPFSEQGAAKGNSERDLECTVVGWWQELLHNKRSVVRCVIVMQKPLSLPATCHAASSKLHSTTSA